MLAFWRFPSAIEIQLVANEFSEDEITKPITISRFEEVDTTYEKYFLGVPHFPKIYLKGDGKLKAVKYIYAISEYGKKVIIPIENIEKKKLQFLIKNPYFYMNENKSALPYDHNFQN